MRTMSRVDDGWTPRWMEGRRVGTRVGVRWEGLKTAAEIMGTTTEAVRKRAKRGTLASETGEDGRLYVRVDGRADD